jgi:hypothetical protein
MAKAAPQSYGEAWESAQALIRAGRLNDPDEHYPYKYEHVTAVIDLNPPMGPDGPDDDRVRAEDFISQQIADATKDYIDAQAAYLDDPGDATREAYKTATDTLVTARQAHRVNRGGVSVVGIRARRAGE